MFRHTIDLNAILQWSLIENASCAQTVPICIIELDFLKHFIDLFPQKSQSVQSYYVRPFAFYVTKNYGYMCAWVARV